VNDAGQRVCSAGYCTNTTKISELNKLCNSLGISNLSLVDTKYSLDMKLDFCIDAFPFGLLLSKNSYGILDFTNSSCKFEIPEFVSCGDIKDIHEKDLTIKGYHDAYVDILDRSEFNLQNQNETETELCKNAYKDWLCSSTHLTYTFNNKTLKGCKSTSDNVCFLCPSFKPNDTYGGFMAFQCNENTSKTADDEACEPQCISQKSISRLIQGDKHSTS